MKSSTTSRQSLCMSTAASPPADGPTTVIVGGVDRSPAAVFDPAYIAAWLGSRKCRAAVVCGVAMTGLSASTGEGLMDKNDSGPPDILWGRGLCVTDSRWFTVIDDEESEKSKNVDRASSCSVSASESLLWADISPSGMADDHLEGPTHSVIDRTCTDHALALRVL